MFIILDSLNALISKLHCLNEIFPDLNLAKQYIYHNIPSFELLYQPWLIFFHLYRASSTLIICVRRRERECTYFRSTSKIGRINLAMRDCMSSCDVTINNYSFFLQLSLLHILQIFICLLYTSPSPRDLSTSRMPSSA